MTFTGSITLGAPREAVFKALQDIHFFASCIAGLRDLAEAGPDRYDAVLETKVAYMSFAFKVRAEIIAMNFPDRIAARIEGSPLGIAGRLTASSTTTLSEDNGITRIDYEMDVNLSGRLGGIGQSVLRSKAKEMEREFAARLARPFSGASAEASS